ncbi:acetyltransferase, gnat family, putative [Fulvivirga imtechensis AK7]|uniref:Acetyltransferase, gnat family, putative n=1 Tax=Fulvivirga imtechensis AK7 TaxID=1237149 RepID=L8JZG2_9BACT|nr:GNAT family N-acetyltransferase [Fulvivirga imtechensis]ELR73548.1 acetyltransferase, gnat family, putative [Fulvivirga imtechensis AK7]
MYLASERLVYSKFRESEYAIYASWYTNAAVMKHITGKALTEQEARERFGKAMATNQEHPDMGFFAARLKATNQFIGIAKLAYYQSEYIEVGYGFLPEYWGKGFATEMLTFLVDYSRHLPGGRDLIAIVDPKNTGSKKVLTNQGFVLYDSKPEDGRPTEYYKLSWVRYSGTD